MGEDTNRRGLGGEGIIGGGREGEDDGFIGFGKGIGDGDDGEGDRGLAGRDDGGGGKGLVVDGWAGGACGGEWDGKGEPVLEMVKDPKSLPTSVAVGSVAVTETWTGSLSWMVTVAVAGAMIV